MEDTVDGEFFYLKWNNFSKQVANQYELLRNSKVLTDISFVCDGKRLEAHKLVLYACSPYFRELIEEDLGSKHLVFFFSDVKYEIMKAILEYIYMGEVHIKNEYLKDFIRVAEKLNIRGLTGAGELDLKDPEPQQAEKRQRLEEKETTTTTAATTTAAKETTVSEVGQAICSALADKQEISNIEVEYTEVQEENTLMPSLKSEAAQWIEENLDATSMDSTGPKSIGPPGAIDDDRPGTSKRLSNCMTPATCNICGRVYSNASNLKQHHRLIHNPAPVICPICKKHYSSNLYLKRHFNAVHGQGQTHKHEEWEMFDATKQN